MAQSETCARAASCLLSRGENTVGRDHRRGHRRARLGARAASARLLPLSLRAVGGAHGNRSGRRAVGERHARAGAPRPSRRRPQRLDRADRAHPSRRPHRRADFEPSGEARRKLPCSLPRALFRHPSRRSAKGTERALGRSNRIGSPSRATRGVALERPNDLRERRRARRRSRDRRGRSPLAGAAVHRRNAGRCLFEDERVSRHRSGRNPPRASRPRGAAVLDGAKSASAALRDRQSGRGHQLLRSRRGAGGLAARRTSGSSPRRPARRLAASRTGIRP